MLGGGGGGRGFSFKAKAVRKSRQRGGRCARQRDAEEEARGTRLPRAPITCTPYAAHHGVL
jgi:hypothetical protein